MTSSRRIPTRSTLAACISSLALLGISGAAHALGNDTVFITLNTGVSYDSNLFRLDDDLTVGPSGSTRVTPNGNTHRDEIIYYYGVGLSANVPVSRQRFFADIEINDNRYVHNSYLNHVGGSARASWAWAVGNDWHGDLGMTYSQALENFDYTFATRRELVDNQNYFFNPRYRLAPNFELQAGINYAETTHSERSFNDFHSLGTQFGISYVTPSGNFVGLQVQSWDARYNTTRNDYTDWRYSTFFDWQVTGNSKFDGSIGIKQRQHDTFTERDFTGWTGSVGWAWTPTGRTRVRVQLARDIGGIEDNEITYARTYSASIAPTYQLSAKVSLNALLSYQQLTFFGNAINVPGEPTFDPRADQKDKIYTFGIGAGYQAMRTLRLGLNYAYEHRNSNKRFQDFDDHTISLNGRLTF